MRKLSFVGVGNMGAPMAINLAKAGHDVILYDTNVAHAEDVAARCGAKTTTSISEVADGDVCFLMLPTSAIVRQVLMEAEGGAFVANAKPGTIVVDMSSSEPSETRETGRMLAEKGIILIDAPVSGGMPRAEAGTLAIMIGGDDASAIEDVMPLLQLLGDRLFKVGPLGAGDAMKAANNFAAAANYAATAEALAMGVAAGLDPATMIEIMGVSTGQSFSGDVLFGKNAVLGKYASGFALALLSKDVGIAERMAGGSDIDAPITRIVAERYRHALEALPKGADNTEAVRAWYQTL